MKPKTHLLLIDPQNDFCDLPASHLGAGAAPSLPVAGAHADMQRVARFIRAHAAQLDGITITLDSHQRFDIAHPGFWQQAEGAAVPAFTPITAAQVRAGAFGPRNAAALPRTLAYLYALEAQARYTLMVWPVHCEIGSWGHGVHADVLAACGDWQLQRQRAVHNVFKGMNPWTEHYSAIQAEVVDASDPGTGLNTRLLQRLSTADLLLIAGEASSHCVRATTEHLLEHLPRLQAAGAQPAHIVLLTDCMSPVAGFEAQHQAFLDAMKLQGVRLEKSNEICL